MKRIKELNMLDELQKFIKAINSGRHRKKNGSRILKSSLQKMVITCKTLKDFSEKKQIPLKIRLISGKNKREELSQKYYWKKFYQKLNDYLYDDLDCYDNYVGSVIKDIKTFCNYLVIERNLPIGNFYKQFYVCKENIRILTLQPDQLNFLIHDKDFENSLRPGLKKIKDILVVGCTVALRYSDLSNLQIFNLEMNGCENYLNVQSQKTKVYTKIKLPDYVIDIFRKYRNGNNRLLPYFNLVRFNLCLKQLAKKAGLTNEIIKTRQKRGIATTVYKDPVKKIHYQFCDLVSSHIMRRTAITTMLRLQMQEHVVRKISGHAADSREFHKYVSIAQNYLDTETDKVFAKLQSMRGESLQPI